MTAILPNIALTLKFVLLLSGLLAQPVFGSPLSPTLERLGLSWDLGPSKHTPRQNVYLLVPHMSKELDQQPLQALLDSLADKLGYKVNLVAAPPTETTTMTTASSNTTSEQPISSTTTEKSFSQSHAFNERKTFSFSQSDNRENETKDELRPVDDKFFLNSCSKAVYNCCSKDNLDYFHYRCFELNGCEGMFIDPQPCKFYPALRAKVLAYQKL